MILRSTLIVSSCLLVWFVVANYYHLPSYILPTPTTTLIALWQHAPLILMHGCITFMETIVGFITGSISGICLALIITRYPYLARWFMPIILVSQSIPLIVLAPLFVIWFGYGVIAKITIVALMVFFPVTHTLFNGLTETNPSWLDLAYSLQATPQMILLKLRLPAAFPQLASGLQIASVYAPMGAIMSEWVGAEHGLGYLLLQANANMQIDLMFACVFSLVIMTLALVFMVRWGLKRFRVPSC